MFSLDKKYIVHPEGDSCSAEDSGALDEKQTFEKDLNHFKWGKEALPLLKALKNQELIDGLFIKGTKFHVLDFLKFCSTRDAPGQVQTDSNKKILTVLKKLREQGFFLPECYVTSKFAKQYLCSKK